MERKILDLGCGTRKHEGAIGVDINPGAAVDIVHDLDCFPYPFEDSSFDEIHIDNVLEHLADVVGTLEELHRISKTGGLVVVHVPYFRAKWAFIDPTHRHFFTTESFTYFDPAHIHSTVYPYSAIRFRTERVVFNERVKRGILTALVRSVANKWPMRYETYMSHLYPLDELTFHLRAVK
jgi:predicted SAM-dependent methyltransferase